MRILYLEGDRCSPKYVRGGMRRLGFEVDCVLGQRLHQPVAGYDLIIASDYEAHLMGEEGMRAIVAAVDRGTGFLMVGGWTSFGRGGYAGTVLERMLPATLTPGDDRVHAPMGAYLFEGTPHPILDRLPLDRAPVITGYNRLVPAEDAQVVLEARPVVATGQREVSLARRADPILLLRQDTDTRVAALATDLAPHWSGGWTDWGDQLVDVGGGEELGNAYLRFLAQLCSWAARTPLPDEAWRVIRAR